MEPHAHRHYRVYGYRSHSGLIPGLILVGVGALFFLNNLHIIYIRDWIAWWPAILIAVGIVKLVDSTYTGGRVAGGILAGLGGIFLAQTLGFLQIRLHDLWPLVLIGLGLLLLFQRFVTPAQLLDQAGNPRLSNGPGHPIFEAGVAFEETGAPTGLDTLKIDAIFSGGKRLVNTQDFKGGEINTIFGGIELDLRQAGMVADSAILEVNAIFGGVEIKIPQNWSAVVEGMGIFGGYGDNTLQPYPQAPGVKRLILRGAAVFGGVDVKN